MFGRRKQAVPGNDPASVVAKAWRQTLDGSSLAADVPFDQAGGDSLRLLKLIFLMEEATGLRLPMEACHVGLRPGEFAQVVQRAMQTAGDAAKEPPGTIFLIPGMGGESTLEGGFRAGCAPDLNIATIDLPDWPAMIAGDFTMASLVRQTVAEIDARSSTGPVRLVGFSLGGHVAFAVAQALVALGREVSFLGILDTNTARLKPPEAHGPAPIRLLRRIRWQLHNLAQAARRGETADRMGLIVAEFLTRPGKPGRRRLATRLQQMPMPANLAMFVNIYLREELHSALLRAWQDDASYRSWPLDAPVALFRSEEHIAGEPDDLGWRLLCPRLRVVNVSGGHKSMLRAPHLERLCACFIREVNHAVATPVRRLVA